MQIVKKIKEITAEFEVLHYPMKKNNNNNNKQ